MALNHAFRYMIISFKILRELHKRIIYNGRKCVYIKPVCMNVIRSVLELYLVRMS